MPSMISKRWLINGLLFLVIGVSALIGYREQEGLTGETGPTISSLNPAEVNLISIQVADRLIFLKKSGDLWIIDSPIQWPANIVTVDRILSILLSRSEASIEAQEINLSELDLANPQVVLTLNQTRISFGTLNNIGARRYLMLDNRIHLVDDLHFPLITQKISALIDKRLIPPSIRLDSFKIADKQLLRSEDNSWQLKSPTDISAQQLGDLVNNWQNLEAPVVKIYKPAEQSLASVVAGRSSGPEMEYRLISKEPELVIARVDLGIQYHFGIAAYRQLFEFPVSGS